MIPSERASVSWALHIPVACQHSFARNFTLQFSVGVANPQFWGRGGRRGSGMVPFERALVNFYTSSIVTFLLSLRVSEILLLLFSSTPLFPYPTFSLPQISPCSPGTTPCLKKTVQTYFLSELCQISTDCTNF